MTHTCNFTYNNKYFDKLGFYSGTAKTVQLVDNTSSDIIRPISSNNTKENPCGMHDENFQVIWGDYTACGNGWVGGHKFDLNYSKNMSCPKGNCVDTTAGGKANVCQKPLTVEKDDICGNAVDYLCGQEGEYIKQCIIDNSDTLVKQVCNFPKEGITTPEDIETNVDGIYTKYQGYKNKGSFPNLYK